MTQAVMMNNEDYILAPLGNRTPTKQSPRLFRSPPQPHMCIHATLQDSHIPCYINVMSWSRVGLPLRPDAPIPLYGGMQVPYNDKSCNNIKQKPIVFAVMANPEILKKNGKTAQNLQDRDTLIDLMLEFVEAMNPDIQFTRRFVVLNNRDLTGELKDIWAVVQRKRAREKLAHNVSQSDENCHPQKNVEDQAISNSILYQERDKDNEINNDDIPSESSTNPGHS
ncbi:uncharacterized protein LOC142324557 [Lycorma delicatula]|uniref:uncharacterized protein LOC142324557 n=1 Tax=Lycorma delicatula TaxID=130591 RepID=UPI003F50ED23